MAHQTAPFLSSVTEKFSAAQAGATQTERRIMDHMRGIWDEIPLMNAAELAHDVGVNPSSVTRLAQRLGYRGYPDMQRVIRTELRSRHVPTALPTDSHAAVHWQRELELLSGMQRFPEEPLDDLVAHLAGARQVFVAGTRGSAAAAAYCAYLWSTIRPGVTLLQEHAVGAPEQWMGAGPGDLLVAFTVKRYAQATSQLIGQFLQEQVPVALVTDSAQAPGARHARHVIVLPTRGTQADQVTSGRFASATLPASLGMLLASKLVDRLGTARLDAIERQFEEQDVFSY